MKKILTLLSSIGLAATSKDKKETINGITNVESDSNYIKKSISNVNINVTEIFKLRLVEEESPNNVKGENTLILFRLYASIPVDFYNYVKNEINDQVKTKIDLEDFELVIEHDNNISHDFSIPQAFDVIAKASRNTKKLEGSFGFTIRISA